MINQINNLTAATASIQVVAVVGLIGMSNYFAAVNLAARFRQPEGGLSRVYR